MLNAVVRHAEKAAIDARANHLVASEYATVADAALANWQKRVREGFGGPTFSSAVDGLAADYRDLVAELDAAVTRCAHRPAVLPAKQSPWLIVSRTSTLTRY